MTAAAPSVVVCPRDGTQLVEVERSGVMLDACPTCRGIWLDRGELDKLIAEERPHASDDDFLDEVRGQRERDKDDEQSSPHGRKRRRGGFLENFLGDFGGD